MSAVSAESPRGSADLSTSVSSPQAADGQASDGVPAGHADFGPNQWLVDELYQRYQADPGSVDQAWWSFFADYHPLPESSTIAPPPAPLADGRPAAPIPGTTAAGTTAVRPSTDGQPAATAPAQ